MDVPRHERAARVARAPAAELARALVGAPRLLILGEPTSPTRPDRPNGSPGPHHRRARGHRQDRHDLGVLFTAAALGVAGASSLPVRPAR
ncbi:hypothetical protein [Streptomyces asoensis]|uniref:hypothetical protein n=1 Tax=Streptomyces asoensis TaxID=249586 RepID=UPI003F5424D9